MDITENQDPTGSLEPLSDISIPSTINSSKNSVDLRPSFRKSFKRLSYAEIMRQLNSEAYPRTPTISEMELTEQIQKLISLSSNDIKKPKIQASVPSVTFNNLKLMAESLGDLTAHHQESVKDASKTANYILDWCLDLGIKESKSIEISIFNCLFFVPVLDGSVVVDNVGESGGEETDDEDGWNYIHGDKSNSESGTPQVLVSIQNPPETA